MKGINPKLKLCECGFCNELILYADSRGRPRRFKKGHHSRGKNNPMYGKTKELQPFFGKQHTKEAIEKIRLSL